MNKTKKSKSKIVLGIETSCDETAVCLIEATNAATIYHGNEVIDPTVGGPFVKGPSIKILGNALYSQAEMHAEYGGVFPSLAKREHTKNIVPIFMTALKQAGLFKLKIARGQISDAQKKFVYESFRMEKEISDAVIELLETLEKPAIDLIAVTQGPGLEPALWVGINFAKILGKIWKISVVPTNHMEGHIVSTMIESGSLIRTAPTEVSENNVTAPAEAVVGTEHKEVAFPALALLISGGHTELVLIRNWHEYSVIGRTRDDAVGEAYDKVARILGLPYPGGPKISELADVARGRREAGQSGNPRSALPRPMIATKDYDFSFSGLKTAVLYLVKKMSTQNALSETDKQDIAEEFENAVTEVLIKKTRQAIIDNQIRTLIIGGGVIANTHIRNSFQKMTSLEFVDVTLMIPKIEHSTDNAIMIAVAGFMQFHNKSKNKSSNKSEPATPDFRASGNLSL